MKNGAVVRTDHWRGRLFEPYDPANPQPRLPRAEAEDYEPSPWVEGGQLRHPEAKEPSDGESGASCALRSRRPHPPPDPRGGGRGDELGTTSSQAISVLKERDVLLEMRSALLSIQPIMILPQVHLRKPCYDFYFLQAIEFERLLGQRYRRLHARPRPIRGPH